MIDETNANMALCTALTDEFARCGVRMAVISPGSRSTPLALALYRHPGIDTPVVIDERSGGFVALGAARITDTPVILVCTSGTAAANYHPAVVEADLSSVPLVVITADRPPELRDTGSGQTIDQLKLYGDSVRWFCEMGTHEADDSGLLHFRSSACRAFAASSGDPRPGPVHLNIPLREPLAPLSVPRSVSATSAFARSGRDGGQPLTEVSGPRPNLGMDEARAIAERISTTPRGLVIVGRQTDNCLREPLAGLAAAAGYPILCEPTSQLRSGPHDRSAVITQYNEIVKNRSGLLPGAPELVLRFGEMPTSKMLRTWIEGLDDLHQIHFALQSSWNDPSRKVARLIRVDPPIAARRIATELDRLSSDGDEEWSTAWLEAEREIVERRIATFSKAGSVTREALHCHIGTTLEDGEVVYTASSLAIRDQEEFSPSVSADITFHSNRGANGIDGTIASATGACLAAGRRTTVILGDLAMLHDIGSLATASRCGKKLRIVVVNDSGGRIFDRLPQKDHMDPETFVSLMSTPSDLDIASAARAFGIRHVRIESASELDALDSSYGCLCEIVMPDGS